MFLQVRQLSNPRGVYIQLMEMLARLAGLGLVHCDYNEFNLLVCLGTACLPWDGHVGQASCPEHWVTCCCLLVCWFFHVLQFIAWPCPIQVNEEEEITLIDFPQMVSVSHPNAQVWPFMPGCVGMFDADMNCLPFCGVAEINAWV